MKIESTELLKEVEKQRRKGDDCIDKAYNFGLDTIKIIIQGEERLAKFKEGE